MSWLSMMIIFGELLGLCDPALAEILVGHVGLKGWWIKSTGLVAKKDLRLVEGSNRTFSLAHAVHFISTFPFCGQLWEWCLTPQKGQMGSIGQDGAVCPAFWQL